MPSETVYFKDEQYSFLEGMVDETSGINNISQAVQYCVNRADQMEGFDDE